jgi:MFS family permease
MSAHWSPRVWGLVFVLSGNMLLDALEVSVVIVALPSIGRDLLLAPIEAQWMMSAFALGFGGLLLFGGRVVALLGRRRVYLFALLAFAVVSVLGGLAGSAWLLIATRFVKGFCAALTAPTGLAIIGSTFAEGPDRNRAVSIYSLFGAGGFSAGLLLSGMFTELDWRWVFLFPAPIALVLLAFGARLIPRDERAEHVVRRYDVGGAICFVLAAVLLLYAIVSVAAVGWNDPRTPGAFALVVLLFSGFVVIERSTASPLIRFGMLARSALIRSSLGAAALNGSFWGFLLVGTFELQSRQDWTPWQTALVFLPASMIPALSAPFAGRMVSRFGPARLIALGAAAPPCGYVLYLSSNTLHVTDVLLAMVLVGVGFAFCFAALHVQATAGVPGGELKMTSGAYQTSVQIGGAVMLALVAGLLPVEKADVTQYRSALLLTTAVGIAGMLVALLGVLPQRRSGAHKDLENPHEQQENQPGRRRGLTAQHGDGDIGRGRE